MSVQEKSLVPLCLAQGESELMQCPAERPRTRRLTEPQSEERGGELGRLQAMAPVPVRQESQEASFPTPRVGSDAGVPEEAEGCDGSPR